MLCLVSDTHGTDGHRLAGRTAEAVRAADVVVHAGDFHRTPAFDGFRGAAKRLRAVHGNNDDDAIRDRLPAARTVTYRGVRLAVRHQPRGGRAGLVAFGRERDADAVVVGHSHRPGVDAAGDVPLINPGSHAQPRGGRASHAELEPTDGGGLDGRLVTVDGETFERFAVAGGAGGG